VSKHIESRESGFNQRSRITRIGAVRGLAEICTDSERRDGQPLRLSKVSLSGDLFEFFARTVPCRPALQPWLIVISSLLRLSLYLLNSLASSFRRSQQGREHARKNPPVRPNLFSRKKIFTFARVAVKNHRAQEAEVFAQFGCGLPGSCRGGRRRSSWLPDNRAPLSSADPWLAGISETKSKGSRQPGRHALQRCRWSALRPCVAESRRPGPEFRRRHFRPGTQGIIPIFQASCGSPPPASKSSSSLARFPLLFKSCAQTSYRPFPETPTKTVHFHVVLFLAAAGKNTAPGTFSFRSRGRPGNVGVAGEFLIWQRRTLKKSSTAVGHTFCAGAARRGERAHK